MSAILERYEVYVRRPGDQQSLQLDGLLKIHTEPAVLSLFNDLVAAATKPVSEEAKQWLFAQDWSEIQVLGPNGFSRRWERARWEAEEAKARDNQPAQNG